MLDKALSWFNGRFQRFRWFHHVEVQQDPPAIFVHVKKLSDMFNEDIPKNWYGIPVRPVYKLGQYYG